MSGRHHLMMRRLVVAVLVLHAWLLAGLSPSGAAAANASGTGLVNGMPCANLCKAYMAWSDRMMAQFHPAQHRAPLRPATAAHPKNPEQPPRDAAPTRRPGLNAFARLQHQADPAPAAPPPVEEAPPQVETAAAPPTDPVAELTAMADSVAEQRANTGNATTAAAEATPVSFVDPLAMTAEPVTTGQVASGSPRRLPVSLILALCAMLAFGCWWWIRGTQATDAMQSYPGPADA
jgi:hypothetical protein